MVGESGVTELTALPGLEVFESTQPSPNRGHWLEHAPSPRLMLFAGRSHPELAQRIADELEIEPGAVDLKTFANGEIYCRYLESIRGADVFIVQSPHPNPNEHLMELWIMVNAAKLASAKRITAVLPWYPYSRQDKKSAPREPITAKLVADFLQAAGADRVLTMDLHAGQIQGFFDIPVDHMTALPIFAQYFKDQGLAGEDVVSVSPDAGRAKMGRRFAEMLDGKFALLNKTRPTHDAAAHTEVIGEVHNKVAIMNDDIIVTGGTLLSGATALREAGARSVYACATHALFPAGALAKLAASDIEKIVVTDTVPVGVLDRPDKLTVLPVAKLLAESIRNVFADESVSAIFAGENQLF
jgi:ribose-phosphate pyrophosphokinase